MTPVKWVHRELLVDERASVDVSILPNYIPVIELSSLREVVEGLKRNAENEPEQNGYLSAIMDLQRLLASLGEGK